MQEVLEYLYKHTNNPSLMSVAEAIEIYGATLELGIHWDDFHCSASGCIFSMDDPDYVAKITGDGSEVKLFRVVQQLRLKGFVEIKLIQPLGINAWLIIKEKVTPLDHLWPQHAEWDEASARWVDFMHVYYQEMNDFKQNRIPLITAISRLRTHLRKHGPKEATNIFQSLRQLAYKDIFLRDLDPDNIGVDDDGQLVIYDAQIGD